MRRHVGHDSVCSSILLQRLCLQHACGSFAIVCRWFHDSKQLLICTCWCDAADGDVRGSARRTHQQQSLFSRRLRSKPMDLR